MLVFWGLDGYYLRQERLFRTLYDRVRTATEDLQFSIDTTTVSSHVAGWLDVTVSVTLRWFYGSRVALLIRHSSGATRRDRAAALASAHLAASHRQPDEAPLSQRVERTLGELHRALRLAGVREGPGEVVVDPHPLFWRDVRIARGFFHQALERFVRFVLGERTSLLHEIDEPDSPDQVVSRAAQRRKSLTSKLA